MLRGITPIDSAFDLLGLHQAYALTQFIFVGSIAGKAAFALGFALSLTAVFSRSDFRPLYIFVFTFFCLWFLLVMPRARAQLPVSAMEARGFKAISAADIIRKEGVAELTVNPVVDTVCCYVDTLVIGAAAVMERGVKGGGYLVSPFLRPKVSLLAAGIIRQGIRDPRLKEKLVAFCQDHFWPALHRAGVPGEGAWCGHPSVVAAYSNEGRGQWERLFEELLAHADRNGIFTRAAAVLSDGKIDRDAVVRALLRCELGENLADYTRLTYAARRQVHRDEASASAMVDWRLCVFQALPLWQGAALYAAGLALAGFLVMGLVAGRVGPLLWALALYASVKFWTLGWALIDHLIRSGYTAGSGPWWEMAMLSGCAALGALAVPLVITGGTIMVLMKGRGGR